MMARIGNWIGMAAVLFASGSAAQAPGPATPMFADDSPIHLVVRGPIPSIVRSAEGGNVPQPGTVSLVGGSGESFPVAISARGITRRMSATCSFPPLRLDLQSRPAASSYFAGQKRLKLVTHCRNDAGFQRYLLLEYAAYRMYNLLTPLSFRAKLATVDYQDVDGRPIVSRAGFLIEDLGDLARRNGLVEVKTGPRISPAILRRTDAARFALFEYLVSNLDWAMSAGPVGDNCCHNARLVSPRGASSNLIVVPYDFDFSGMVNAPYASPPEGIPVANVRERRYRGYCFTNAEALVEAARMRAMRGPIIAVLDTIPGLDPRAAAGAKAYLERSFADIATDADVTRKLFKTCL
ncbi:MAG: hypothetical protein ABIT68_03135 [Sphingomicrobium sp.]